MPLVDRLRVAGAVVLTVLATAALSGCTHAGKPAAASDDGLTTAGPFPAVTGNFGDAPTITFPAKLQPSAKLQRKILRLGTGPKLAIGDLIATDYLGQVWGGKVFQNSYSDKQAATLQFGLGTLLPGIDSGLLNVPVGSRVELTVPPADAYGSVGDESLGIKADQSLVFVFDIARRFNGKSSADGNATPQAQSPALPQVTGKLTQAPLISFPKQVKLPARRTTYMIARGTGAPLTQGSAVIQYYSVNGRDSFVSSTWLQGTPTAVPVGAATDATGGVFDDLVGVPVGSRVLIVAPAPAGPHQTDNTAVVAVDVLAQVGSAKQMAR